jgi:diguanylate cyclase (GGDEF)-like protein
LGWIKKELEKSGKEFRSELLKIFAAGLAAGISAIVIAQYKTTRDFFAKTASIPYFVLTLICIAVAGAAVMFFLSRIKIERLSRELAELRDTATRDALTNLYNANQIQTALGERITKATTNHEMFSVIMIDIDNFKRINDSYTHTVGDFVLRQVADQLPGRSGGDATFRYGGDEFLIISKPTQHGNEGYGFAERIRREIASTQFLVEENSYDREPLTVSCGVTNFHESDTPKELMSRVSQALHLAKQPRSDGNGFRQAKNFVYVVNKQDQTTPHSR